jgi:DNA sulfur modification protein DndD
MYIKSISLENYRCHKKTEAVFFPGSGKGYISIIEGGDGDGKTTIFNAIGWCLYGKETSELLGEPKQSLGIPNVSTLNDNGLNKISAEAWLEFEESAISGDRPISARALRKANVRGMRILDQVFTLQLYSQNGNPEVLMDAEAERYIESIAPSDLIEFYMFNGEYLSSARNAKGENINASIKRQFRTGSILSMEGILKTLENDYRGSANRAAKKQDNTIIENIVQLEASISQDKSKKEALEADVIDYREKEKEAKTRMNKYREEKIKIESKKELLKELSEKREKRKKLLIDTKEAYKRLFKAKLDYGYLILSKNTLSESYSKIKGEIGKGKLPPNIKKEFVADLISMHQCICGRDLPEGTMEIEKIKAILDDSERESNKNILLEISPVINGIIQILESKAPEMLNTLENSIRQNLQEQRELADEIESSDSMGISLTSEESIVISEFDKAEQDFTNFHSLADEIEGRAKQLESKIASSTNRIRELKDKQEKMVGKTEEAKRFQDWAKTAKILGEVLFDLRGKISDMFISSLQAEVNRLILSIRGLSHLSVSIKNVGGSVKVDYADSYLPLEEAAYLSEGQNQIISIALIAAYSSVLKNMGNGIAEAPFIVMDHPFSDLGLPRKEEILKSFGTLFEGTKVIMLTPPGDFDFKPLAQSLASHYSVKNDPQQKICSLEVP